MFKIPYYVSDGGDGSANLQLTRSLEEAETLDDEQCAWGEPSAGTIDVEIRDGKLFYRFYGDNGWEWLEATS